MSQLLFLSSARFILRTRGVWPQWEPPEGAQMSPLVYMELVCVNFGFRLVCTHARNLLGLVINKNYYQFCPWMVLSVSVALVWALLCPVLGREVLHGTPWPRELLCEKSECSGRRRQGLPVSVEAADGAQQWRWRMCRASCGAGHQWSKLLFVVVPVQGSQQSGIWFAETNSCLVNYCLLIISVYIHLLPLCC